MKTIVNNLSSDLTVKTVMRQLFILQMELETMRGLSSEVDPKLTEIIESIDLLFEAIVKIES